MLERVKEAMAAYKNIISRPIADDEDGWSPPPSDFLRDKKWSKELRWMWPDYTSVKVGDTRFYVEKKKWCKENAQYYWVAGNQNVWYFQIEIPQYCSSCPLAAK